MPEWHITKSGQEPTNPVQPQLLTIIENGIAKYYQYLNDFSLKSYHSEKFHQRRIPLMTISCRLSKSVHQMIPSYR